MPYAQVDGRWTVSDDILLNFARKAIAEGTFWTVFYDSSIDGPEAYLRAMKQPANVPVFCFLGAEPIACAWLNGHSGGRAFGHFLVTSSVKGHTQECGRICLDYWFSFRVNGRQLFDVILGVIPSFNRSAIEFVKRIGLTVLGEVPKAVRIDGEPQPATLLYAVR